MTNQKWKRMIGLAALLMLWGAADAKAQVRPGGITFANQLDIPIQIQGTSFVNGVPTKSQPILVFAAKSACDPNVPKGFRQILIFDANRPNVILLKKTINFPGFDVMYFVRPNLNPANPYPIDLYAPKLPGTP
jgi:hypothetical protein